MTAPPCNPRSTPSGAACAGRAFTAIAWSIFAAGLGWSAGVAWHLPVMRSLGLLSDPASVSTSAPVALQSTFSCPMHPSYHSEQAGDCPVCNMKMTRQEGALAPAVSTVAGHATLELSPARRQLIGVRTALVELRACSRTLRAAARVEVDENGLSSVSLKTSGWVDELFVRSVGAVVEAGQPLFTFYSPELFEAQRKYILASALLAQNLAAGGEELDASKRQRIETTRARLALWDMTDEQIAALDQPGAEPLGTTPILARSRGVVLDRTIIKGARVEPGQALFELADMTRVWVVAEVYASELTLVAVGASVEIELEGLPGESLAGRVDYVYPTLDVDTRTARVRVVVENEAGHLKPGMYATASIALELGEQLLIDDEAVLDTGLRQLVFVELAPGEFEPREVCIGARWDGHALVLSGLEAGERIVTSGTFLIDSESRLRAALSGCNQAAPAQ